jgi:hypothetical protein
MKHYQLKINVPIINSIRGTKTGETHENAEKGRSHTPHRVIDLTQREASWWSLSCSNGYVLPKHQDCKSECMS